MSVRIPACEPVNETASWPRSLIAIETSAIEIRSPAVSSMSISRRFGRSATFDGEVDQLVGRVAHRRDDRADAVALLGGADDPPGDALDLLRAGDRGAAVLLRDDGHGRETYPRCAEPRSMIGACRCARRCRRNGSTGRAGPRQVPPEHPFLELQGRLGNAALARLIQRKDRPASTDAPGAHHKPKHGKEPAKKPVPDVHGRVLKIDIEHDVPVATITAGSERGVKVGMTGSLIENGKEVVDFTVDEVTGAWCRAHVHTNYDTVHRASEAVIKASQFHEESQEGKEF